MSDTPGRLFRLLGLLQARSYWTGAELAERLEVTRRTVRRDVDRLRDFGYPIRSSAGVAGGYQLGSGRSMPPLLLEDDEVLAVALGLRTAALGSVAGVEEPAVRALVKLEQMLPARLRRRMNDLHAAVAPLYPSSAPRVSADTLSLLASASRNDQPLRLTYGDAEGRETKREVEPHALVHTGARWYLLTWDRSREDWRTFRVDRIVQARVDERARFARRTIPGGDAAAYVARSIATRAHKTCARVVLHAPLEQMAAGIPATIAHLEKRDEHSCILESGAASLYRLAFHLAMLDVDIDVLEPDELRAAFRAVAKRASRAARGKGEPK